MAKIMLEDDVIRVELSPLDEFLALHGSLRIPLSHVTATSVGDESGWSMMWRKIVGTNAPPFKVAGTYLTSAGWTFCDFTDGKNCLTILTKNEHYGKIVVQLDAGEDPVAISAEITRRIGAPGPAAG